MEQIKELLPKPAAKDTYREEEPLAAVDPARAIVGQTACRHKAVKVRVHPEPLIPGVKDGKKSNSGPHTFGIGSDRNQSF
jgi:hypothetical protein